MFLESRHHVFLNSAAKETMWYTGTLLGSQRCLLTDARENGILEPVWFIICQASDLKWLTMTIKPGLVWGETSHETSSSVYAQVAKCYHRSDKATVHAKNIQGHNHTCFSGKFPVHLFLTFQATCFTGCVGGRTIVKQIMLFSKVQENRERVFRVLFSLSLSLFSIQVSRWQVKYQLVS